MLKLRPFKNIDAEKIVSWIGDEEAFYKWSAGRYDHYPIVAEDMINAYKDNGEEATLFPFVAFDEDGLAGHLIMRYPTEDKRLIRFGFIIIDPQRRGQGTGKAMIKLALDYAFNILGAAKVTLGVFDDNPDAKYCYEAAGLKYSDCKPEIYTLNGNDKVCLWMECNKYKFYGWDNTNTRAVNSVYKGINTPLDLYDALSHVWCADTCAPRMRMDWSRENMTLGQCSITAFLCQDIFGGKVYGVPTTNGNFHCYNVIGDCLFDLTSEQFGDRVLVYENNPEQLREVHFAKTEKYERYELLKSLLKEYLQ